MGDRNCIFCKIAGGEIPSYTLYDDDDFKVIFDAGPATKGHALVIPKGHYANVFEMPEQLVAKAYITAKKVGAVLRKLTECDGMNILQNNGEAAGQSVFHFHIHIIPRYSDDTATIKWAQGDVDKDYLSSLAEKVNKTINNS